MNPQNVWVQKTAAHFCHHSCPFNLNFIYWWLIQYPPTQHLRLQKSTKYIYPPYHIKVMPSAWQATLNALREEFFAGQQMFLKCCLVSNCFPTETTTPLAGLNHGAQGASITPFHSGVMVRFWFTALDNLPKAEHNGPPWEIMESIGLQSQPLSSVVSSQNGLNGRIIIFAALVLREQMEV